MRVEAAASAYRVEKDRSRAMLALATGETVRGSFFVAASGVKVPGRERVGDILNAELGFFPFEVESDGSRRTVMFNRAHVVTVTLSDAEARRDPGYQVATERLVSIRLATGEALVGSVRVYRPEGRDRLSDWARGEDRFRYIETADATILVNAAHIVEVSEPRS
jgi:hypothetical protein